MMLLSNTILQLAKKSLELEDKPLFRARGQPIRGGKLSRSWNRGGGWDMEAAASWGNKDGRLRKERAESSSVKRGK